MPCLSIKQRFLLLVTAALLFGFIPAVHAEGLSGLKGSLKKGNINEDNAIETPVQLPDIKAKKPLVLRQTKNNESNNVIGVFAPKTIKIKNKGKITIPQFNYIKTPPNFLSIKTSKPKRISDPKLVPVEINSEKADFSYTPLPDDSELFNGITSTDEIQAKANAIKELRRLETEFHKNPPSSEYATYNLEAHAQIFVNENSKYPDLCALMRLVALEEFVKRSWQGLTQDNTYNNPQGLEAKYYIIGKFNEIIRYYSSYTDSTIASVINKSQNRIAQINQYVQPHIESIKQRIALFIPYNEENKKYIKNFLADTYLDYQQSEFPRNIKYMYRGIFDNYNQLAAAYYLTRNYSQLALLEKEMDDYYAQISSKVTIKFKTPQGAIFEKTFENIKEPDAYLSVKASIVLQSAKSILFDENCPLGYNDIKTKSEEIIKQIDNAEPPYPDYLSSVKRNLEYYKQRPIIKKIKFYKDEKTPIGETEICNPTDRLIIKFEIENPIINGNYVMAYPFEILFESTTSKRTRKIMVKQNSFYVFYQETVQFNQNNSNEEAYKDKNLINNAKRETSGFLLPKKTYISLYDMEVFNLPAYIFYSTNNFFNEKTQNSNGYATWYDREYNKGLNDHLSNHSPIDPAELKQKYTNNNIIKPSSSFLKSAGMEYVQAYYMKNDPQSVKAQVALKNQADVFIVDVHGWDTGTYNNIKPNGGLIEAALPDSEGDPDTSEILVKLPLYDLIKKDGSSEYSENLKLLVLLSCSCLDWRGNWQSENPKDWIFAHGWYKVLPQGLILGYTTEPRAMVTKNAIARFNSLLLESANKNLTFSSICQEWGKMNEDAYRTYIKNPEENRSYEGAEGASIIIGKKRFTFRPVRVSQGSLSLYKFMVNKPDNF